MRSARSLGKLRRPRAPRAQPARGPGPTGELVFAGPLPPAPTGIATYDRAVLDGLERIGFIDRHRMDVAVADRAEGHAGRSPATASAIFQLGNNVEFHLEIYRAAFLTPALVVLHDLALDDFVRGLKTLGDPLGYMAAREAARAAPEPDLDPTSCATSRSAIRGARTSARRARGIVVHAEFGQRYLEELGCRTPVFVVPHPVVETPAAMAKRREARGRELRAGLGARGARQVVVAPGDLNEAKRLDALLEAAQQLPDDVHVALVGRRIERLRHRPRRRGSGGWATA